MSTVFDAAAIVVDGSTSALQPAVSTVNVVVSQTIQSVNLTVPNTTSAIEVQLPGVQGPPGLQNVFVQSNDPAVEFGWGMEEKGFIWAQTVE